MLELKQCMKNQVRLYFLLTSNVSIHMIFVIKNVYIIHFSLQPGEPNNSRQGSREQVYTFVHKTHSYFLFSRTLKILYFIFYAILISTFKIFIQLIYWPKPPPPSKLMYNGILVSVCVSLSRIMACRQCSLF